VIRGSPCAYHSPCPAGPMVGGDPPPVKGKTGRMQISEQPVSEELRKPTAEWTPRFLKNGDAGSASNGRAPSLGIASTLAGRSAASSDLERERQTLMVIEEYAWATPGRVLPMRTPGRPGEARRAWDSRVTSDRGVASVAFMPAI
jgi:hypothetical protein